MNTRILLATSTLLTTLSGFGQGTIFFNNRTPTGDAPISRWDGSGAGAGLTAQLMLVTAGGVLTPLYPTTTFRTSSPAAAYFVEPVTVTVPGVPAGSPAVIRMRVWTGESYESVEYPFHGESNDIVIPQLGGIPPDGSPPIPTPGLSGLQGFQVPEPSSLTLGIFGAVTLLFLRRRRPLS